MIVIIGILARCSNFQRFAATKEMMRDLPPGVVLDGSAAIKGPGNSLTGRTKKEFLRRWFTNGRLLMGESVLTYGYPIDGPVNGGFYPF